MTKHAYVPKNTITGKSSMLVSQVIALPGRNGGTVLVIELRIRVVTTFEESFDIFWISVHFDHPSDKSIFLLQTPGSKF